jgi:hypothetical protein
MHHGSRLRFALLVVCFTCIYTSRFAEKMNSFLVVQD